MLYLERTPGASLNEFIQTLWYTCVSGPLAGRERVLPSGCTQIIVNVARDYILECIGEGPGIRMAPALVVGARSTYEIVDRSDMADLAGIVFRPAGFAAFARDAADLFSNRNVSLDAVWGSKAGALRERLSRPGSPAEKLNALERFLRDEFVPRRGPHPMVAYALSRVSGAREISTIAEIAADTGWSMRRFSQVFREEVGLTPKAWCRLQRFQRAVKLLHSGADVAWSQMAVDCGYYDQSHFANEFRAFSGIDITTYSARRTRWANHVPA
jgi:AraC-like DNA-binding protein